MLIIRRSRDYDVDAASAESGLYCEDKSLAIQSQRDESDINTIVKRFGVTGVLPVVERQALFLDLDDELDYRTCVDFVMRADRSFLSLPAEVRSRFGNNAELFVEFAGDPANLPQLRLWGLAPKAPEEPIVVAPAAV